VSFLYDYGLEYLAETNMEDRDYRLLLVMTNSTAGDERGAKFVADITTLDEYDGASYARKDLASVAGSLDLTNHFEKITATAPVWTTLGAGTRNCPGMVLYVHITNDAASRLIAYINDAPTFPFNGIGDDVTLTPSVTNGILRLAN
jgi:hypothetical protein